MPKYGKLTQTPTFLKLIRILDFASSVLLMRFKQSLNHISSMFQTQIMFNLEFSAQNAQIWKTRQNPQIFQNLWKFHVI